jgi:hypothetical protein
MKRLIRGTPFGLAPVLVLGACASAPPARQISSREVSEFLSGYVRVVSNGQESFCDNEQDGHFLRDVCYTRAQMKELLFASLRGGSVHSVTAASLSTPSGWNGPTSSGYTSFTGSGR